MNEIKLFDEDQIRTVWVEEERQWYFSVVDVCRVLAEPTNARKYWSVLKTHLKTEGSELTTICSQLKMKSSDGKYYKTDALNTDGILRLIQSIPSKKAEPFKLWLARVGRERLEEISDPELAVQRMHNTYLKKGYSEEWIQKRLQSIDVRKNLTKEWQERGIVDNRDYAILTAEISKGTFGMTPNEYKEFKKLNSPLDNHRDHMTDIELIFTMLGEVQTRNKTVEKDAHGFKENLSAARAGGAAAGAARKAFELESGESVSSQTNFINTSELERRNQIINKTKEN